MRNIGRNSRKTDRHGSDRNRRPSTSRTSGKSGARPPLRKSGSGSGRVSSGKKATPRVARPIRPADSVFASTLKTAASDFVEGHRLQKVLAAAGFGSRRACEQLIADGRVEVDGRVVGLGTRVFPHQQVVKVDGESLPRTKPVYMIVNKPKGILCTNRDQQGRARAIDLIPPEYGRLFPVGRLDQNSEGLLLMTNDGALAERLAHPRYEVAKKYKVQVAGLVDPQIVYDLKKGIHLAEAVVQADEVVLKSRHKLSSIMEITLREGKNREIRRMLARLGHKVLHLQRIAIGPIKLGKLVPGEYRALSTKEVRALYDASRDMEKELTERHKTERSEEV